MVTVEKRSDAVGVPLASEGRPLVAFVEVAGQSGRGLALKVASEDFSDDGRFRRDDQRSRFVVAVATLTPVRLAISGSVNRGVSQPP